MIDISTLLDQARAAGVTVRADGEKLVFRGPRRAVAIVNALGDRKAEVLAILNEPPSTPRRDHDSRDGKSTVSKLARNYEDDPHVVALRAGLANRLEMLQRLDSQDLRLDSQGREIAEIKEQTRSLEDVARSANWWGGENHETVTTFLKNRRICVPDGPWHKGSDKSWYWKVSCEFGDIIRSLHRDVEDNPRCLKKGTGYAEFKPWHYPMAWLEEALPIWVASHGTGRTHWFRHRADLIPQPQNGFSFHEC